MLRPSLKFLRVQDQTLNSFENNTMKLSENEAILTGLWASNCATIQQVLILKFAFRPEKFPRLSRNGPLVYEFIFTAHGKNYCYLQQQQQQQSFY